MELETRTGVETPGYLELGGDQIYYVLHRVAAPKATVLLAGPFATERPYSYNAWARWARFLADNGFAVLRFDYRGVGESTGEFSRMSLSKWIEDFGGITCYLRGQVSSGKLLLHGLGLGGLLASRAFRDGCGDALLLWSAPATGEEALKEGLMRRMAADYAAAPTGRRKGLQDYIAEMDAGASIQMMGYPLTAQLWHDALRHQLYVPGQAEGSSDPRPVRQVKLDRSAAPLIAGVGQWRALNPALRIGFVPLNPDLTPLFRENMQWIEQALQPTKECAA